MEIEILTASSWRDSSDDVESSSWVASSSGTPFSEWTTVFPNPRLCKALLDRITDRAHIIETGRTRSGSSAR
ncbi:MAG: hypothetical protein FJW39_35080 [Acidobacteria bacterium]|nr:hypothetical protein [Acidobacteriota bacterium]